MDLIADIGATNSRCALVDRDGSVVAVQSFLNAEFDSLEDLLDAYLSARRASDKPRCAGLGVAAPILGDQVQMVNISWSFSQKALRERFDLKRLNVVNDFAAIAYGLPDWLDSELYHVGAGEGLPRGNRATLGPGSGLGVASVVHSIDGWCVVGGEGGNISLAANSDEEAELVALLRDETGHCSAERALSGKGLARLYRAVAQVKGRNAERLGAEEITTLALERDYLARETLAAFFRFLGGVAGDLALTTGATGGVFIAGGIVPQLLEQLADSEFRKSFEAKGRYRPYLERIPTAVIVDPIPAFRGLVRLLGYAPE